MERILTGIQPSGKITLGNYLGAIKPWVRYQDEYESFIFIADMHAITVPQDAQELHDNIRQLVAIYIAAGIDPQKNLIYTQSENLYHPALSWILECHTPYGELSRMTQFKDKSRKNESFSSGLLTYPVLMAADILLYDANYVPVGADQTQHVEFARDVAERFNNKYGTTFVVPESLIPSDAAKIKDLQNPNNKMSKSADNDLGVIFLLDDDDAIAKKIRKAATDIDGQIKYFPETKPGISNLIDIYAALSNMSVDAVEAHFSGKNYSEFKRETADLAVHILRPIRERYYELLQSTEIDKTLDRGRDETLPIAKAKYEAVQKLVGLYR